jgi:hypothetical protein
MQIQSGRTVLLNLVTAQQEEGIFFSAHTTTPLTAILGRTNYLPLFPLPLSLFLWVSQQRNVHLLGIFRCMEQNTPIWELVCQPVPQLLPAEKILALSTNNTLYSWTMPFTAQFGRGVCACGGGRAVKDAWYRP